MGMLYRAYENEYFEKQIEYVFDLFFSVYGINRQTISYADLPKLGPEPEDIVISYGKERPDGKFPHHIHIYESHFFGQDYLEPKSMPDTPLKRFGDLPIIYHGHGIVSDWTIAYENAAGGSAIETNIDIVASSFFMLSRYEEAISEERDELGRFPAAASLAYKEGFLERPIVNGYIELLWSWIDSFNLGFKRKKLWGERGFAVCLTHDVDRIRKFRLIPPFFTLKRALLQRRSLRDAGAVFFDYLRALLGLKDDPYQVALGLIISLEKEYGARSSFYFMADGDRYSIKDQWVVTLMRRLENDQFEIGLHGGLDSYENSDILRREKERLEEAVGNPVSGNRQHYLRWKTPETWRALERAGLKYDTTLGFADHAGFRCGICHPYKPFDILENRGLDIWEIPLIVMEGSLFGYQNLSLEEGFEGVQALIDTVERYNGVFVTVWHNSSFYELESPGMFAMYKQMLDYVSSKNALCSTVDGVLTRWLRAVEISQC